MRIASPTEDGPLFLRFLVPSVRMAMRIPVSQYGIQGVGQFIQILKPHSFEGQGTQLLPPRLNQVEPGGMLGDELELDFRLSQQGRQE